MALTINHDTTPKLDKIPECKEHDQSQVAMLTPEDEKRLVRRIDLRLMPLLIISYALQLLDKTSLAYSAILGIKQDLNLVGQQYNWSSSIFYVGFLVASYPVSLGFVRFPLGKYLSLLTLAWGIVITLHAVVHNYAGLMVLRTFLGIMESGISPGFSLITGMWYTPREHVLRHSYWFAGDAIGEIMGSLISYSILHYDGGFSHWKLLFLIFGLIAIAWSTILWFFLPDSPDTATFLTTTEREFASLRPKKFQHTTQTKSWDGTQFIEALVDPKSWWFLVFAFILFVPSGGVTSFSTLIINGFGYDAYQTVLMGLPAAGFQLVSIIIVAIITTKVPRARLNALVGLYLVALAGILMMKLLPEEKRWGRLVGFWLVRSYAPMFPLMMALFASNTAGFTKKSMTAAMLFVGYCVGNFVGPQFFIASEAPGYPTAYTTMLVCFAITIILAIALRVYIVWENGRRDKEQEAHIDPEESRRVDFEIDARLDGVDETDRQNRSFRYVV